MNELTLKHWRIISHMLDKASFPREYLQAAFELSELAKEKLSKAAETTEGDKS